MNTFLKDVIKHQTFQLIGDGNAMIDNISTDSRSMQNNANTLFFALKGANDNAHHYIKELLDKGVKNFVVSEPPKDTSDGNYILVANTLTALQEFASNYRANFNFPVIGVTGSNGKTIVKEWLNFLLSPEYTIIRSPKSYNSQVGVPISVLGINSYHNLGIFEAGISMPQEMEKLEQIIKPTIGVLTNIGDAHNEGFIDKTQKITEKLKLFKNAEVLIYQKNTQVANALEHYTTKQFVWSFSDETNSLCIKKSNSADKTILEFNYDAQEFKGQIPFMDDASVENAVNSMMVLLYLGYDKQILERSMQMLYPIEMRLKVKNGINNCTIIDDSYISDFQSLKIALDFLEQQKQHTKKTVILTDILQSGESPEEFYRKVAQLFIQNNISEIIGIGAGLSAHKDYFRNIKTYIDTSAFLEDFDSDAFANQTILVKGARSFQLEEIVALLEEKTHQTVLEINLNAITHNLNYYKSKIKPQTKIMVMIKAFGYGSGSFEIANLLEYHKVDYLGVAFVDEGIQLRNSNINLPIIVMNPEPNSFAALIHYNLEPEIYSLKELDKFRTELQLAQQTKYPIHLKLDTGMHRLGFEEKDIDELLSYIVKYRNLFEIKTIFSHFSGSDAQVFTEFTQQQFSRFKKLADYIKQALLITPICHISNTSAISNYPEYQLDMVRLGIGLYGISNDEQEIKHLENVGTLKSVILQIKEIEVGESVGYSRGFIAQKKTKIATIPIGYADGIPRALSKGKGYLMVNAQQAPIVGMICMDMLMIDITDIKCKEGDTVVIFGENPKVTTLAKAIDTIAYEILAGISHRVKRMFYRE
ncbi:MAG TPA: bifunctional UDP-N-acetylmuramoyl-tripeptide:D-alanyl-D-alanine ligase/alanine racemase [Flavobacterium sp.]|nr:bifunctional UDP-N-acetylmuramoyl-tripeptide:D-alanyl-D-alanine ligase/alanine racemase [Flavobacterium sp.]